MIEESPLPSPTESALAEVVLRHGIEDFSSLSRNLEAASAEDRIAWALDHFGDGIGMS